MRRRTRSRLQCREPHRLRLEVDETDAFSKDYQDEVFDRQPLLSTTEIEPRELERRTTSSSIDSNRAASAGFTEPDSPLLFAAAGIDSIEGLARIYVHLLGATVGVIAAVLSLPFIILGVLFQVTFGVVRQVFGVTCQVTLLWLKFVCCTGGVLAFLSALFLYLFLSFLQCVTYLLKQASELVAGGRTRGIRWDSNNIPLVIPDVNGAHLNGVR